MGGGVGRGRGWGECVWGEGGGGVARLALKAGESHRPLVREQCNVSCIFVHRLQGLTNKECMLCVLTAFEILSGQGEDVATHLFTYSLYSPLLTVVLKCFFRAMQESV